MSTELNAAPPSPPSQGSSLSFTQGFLLGQLTISLIIFVFIKFFIFGEPPPADVRASHRASLRQQRTLAAASPTASTPPSLLRKRSSRVLSRHHHQNAGAGATTLPTSTILAKTYYNVHAHQPESLDWFNVLVAQTIAQLRADAVADDAVLHQLTEVLNRPGGKPEYVGEIKVTEVALGDEFPILSNCRVVAVNDDGGEAGPGKDGRLQARLDVDLSDMITLGVETKLVLNYPRPFSAVLPVALSVSLVRFSGTLSLSFTPAPPSPSQPSTGTSFSSRPSHSPSLDPTPGSTGQMLTFTFLDDYRLDLSVRSLLGSRSRLQDVPKIAQLVESRLHAWFDERCVEPRFQQIQLPSLWPRKKNTRGGEEDEDEGEREEKEEAVNEGTKGKREGREKEEKTGSIRIGLSGGQSDIDSLDETRLAAEGEKIWEAEQRAQRVERERAREREPDGMRWRGDQSRDVSVAQGRSSEDTLRMPGGMPGVVMS